MKLKFVVFAVFSALLLPIDASHAQEWKRNQEFVDATGTKFAVPLRSTPVGDSWDSYNTVPCTGSPIHPYVVVTAAHCIWGIYGDKGNAFAYNGGVIWVQEPGKKSDDLTAKRIKVLHVLHPDSLGTPETFPAAVVESRDDIAFLVLEKPIVDEVKHKIATLEQIKYAMDNKIKMRVYGYGLNSISEQYAYYATPQQSRYSVSDQLNPRRLEYDFVTEKLPDMYTHHVGFPKMVLAKLPICGAVGTSGSPAVIEINGEEFIIGPGSHSTGWNCPELKDHNEYEAKNHPYYKYRNTFSHIIIANYPDLLEKAMSMIPKVVEVKPIEVSEKTSPAQPTASTIQNSSSQVLEKKPLSQESNKKSKTTIKCIRGKKISYVSGYSPKCPKGYSVAKK